MNRAQLMGRLGKDPESRKLNNGSTVVSFSLATGESWRDKSTGERRDLTDWHNIVVFNEKLGEIVMKYMHKGSRCYIEGAIKTRKWQDQGGADKYITEIVLRGFDCTIKLLDKKGDGDGGSRGSDDRSSGGGSSSRGGGARRNDDMDDEIPF